RGKGTPPSQGTPPADERPPGRSKEAPMPTPVNAYRRQLLAAAAATLAAGQFARFAAAQASGASFGALKQIDAGVLNVGYAEAGPANGPPVVLLHGWPYDIYSFVDATA